MEKTEKDEEEDTKKEEPDDEAGDDETEDGSDEIEKDNPEDIDIRDVRHKLETLNMIGSDVVFLSDFVSRMLHFFSCLVHQFIPCGLGVGES